MSEQECGHASQAAAWVLGTLSADEAERYAEHLELCATCRAEVARLQEAADALVDVAPRATPPSELRARVIAAVEAEAALFRAAEEGQQLPEPAGGRKRLRALVLGGLAGLCLVAVGVIVGGVLTSDERDAPVDTVAGSVTKEGGGPRARAAVVFDGDTQRLVLNDLAAPPEGRVYQAWVVRRPSMPIPTGALFSIPRSADTEITLPPLGDAERVIVTAEPARGSRTPTRPPLVIVTLPQ